MEQRSLPYCLENKRLVGSKGLKVSFCFDRRINLKSFYSTTQIIIWFSLTEPKVQKVMFEGGVLNKKGILYRPKSNYPNHTKNKSSTQPKTHGYQDSFNIAFLRWSIYNLVRLDFNNNKSVWLNCNCCP